MPDTYTPLAIPDAPQPIRLRRATVADAPALALVGAATFLEAFTWMLPGPDIIAHCGHNHTPEAYAHYLAKADTLITLAEVIPGAAPVGYAMLTAPDLPTIDVQLGDIELKRIYLFSRFRTAATQVLDDSGNVIPNLRPAQALMNAAIADAQTLGSKRLLLGTHAGNERAINFYRRNGFVEIGERTFTVGSQVCCDYIFARSL
jgi:diamine N-acetyltransferase